MRPRKGSATAGLAALLVPVVTGLTASAVLLVDYVRPAPVFCDVTGDCARLKQTAYAAWAGVPTPVFGVAGFLFLALLALQRGPRVRLAAAIVASFAALAAAFFVKTQWDLGLWCKWCCTADVSALVACVAAWWRQQAEWDPPEGVAARLALGGAAIAP